jgi:hypothetical protein
MTSRRTALFGAIASCCVTGCWEEIEYTGPDPAATQNAVTPPVEASQPAESHSEPLAPQTVATDSTNSDASGFADELANSMVSEPTTPAETTVAADPPPQPSETNLLPFETADNASSPPPGSEAIVPPTEGEPDIRDQANTVSETVNSAPSKTRLDAWLLGSHLSLAALANDRGLAPENVQKWLDSAKLRAAALGAVVGDLPESGGAGSAQNTSREVLSFLFLQGQQIGRELAKQHGADHAALVEVALKSNLLRVLYSPDSAATAAISAAIAQAAPRAELPAPLWQPLLDLLAAKADPGEVRKAVQNFHTEVERYLTPAAEQ